MALRSITTFLHVCDACGAYWEHSGGKLHSISEAEAVENYPAYFSSQSGQRGSESG